MQEEILEEIKNAMGTGLLSDNFESEIKQISQPYVHNPLLKIPLARQ